MGKQAVKVIIRTRPTPNFATKNIQIDPVNSVSKIALKLTNLNNYIGFKHGLMLLH